MCYNERASWVAFSIGSVSIAVAVERNRREGDISGMLRALSFLPIVVIQLYEALLYRNCSWDGVGLRKLLLFTICIQPLMLFAAAMQFDKQNLSPYLRHVCQLITGVYVISLLASPPSIHTGKTCGKWEIQDWNIIAGVGYHTLLILSLLLPKRGGAVLSAAGVLTCIVASFLGENQPSKWCILAAMTPALLSVV